MRRALPDPDIHPAEEFQEIIRYERARADRAGSPFALVSLELRALLSERRELRKLIRAVRQRIRSTDTLGWLDEQTLSVLLPGTDLKGGIAFAVDFQRQHYGERTPLPFTVYCHPDQWLRSGNGSSPDGRGTISGNNGRRADRGERTEVDPIQRKIAGAMARSLPAWKRTLDIGGALIGLAITAPIFLILAVYLKVVSPGPVLFRQERLGHGELPFAFLKFRTVCADSDPNCHRSHLKELIASDRPMEKLDSGADARIIPGGRVLRKTCIDELPQLLNVLKGEMSLVGPRPCLPYEAEEYLRWHSHRCDVLPGLTGLWQVSGKNRLTFKQMIRLDVSYCQNLSLWLDLEILLRTPATIIGLFFEGVANRFPRSAQARRAAGMAGPVEIGRLPN